MGWQFSGTMNPKWEYTVMKLTTEFGFFSGVDFDAAKFQAELNAKGAAGWELVSVSDIARMQGGTNYVIAVLKRQKA